MYLGACVCPCADVLIRTMKGRSQLGFREPWQRRGQLQSIQLEARWLRWTRSETMRAALRRPSCVPFEDARWRVGSSCHLTQRQYTCGPLAAQVLPLPANGSSMRLLAIELHAHRGEFELTRRSGWKNRQLVQAEQAIGSNRCWIVNRRES